MRDLTEDDLTWIVAQQREICRLREALYRQHGKIYDPILKKVRERA
jgi:hypothetical protein